MKKNIHQKKVFVGMSGGVDSSLTAALLNDKGFDVTGVFIKTWHPDFLPCEWKQERTDAMRVAATLSIPFITLDLENEYKESVADYMIEEYRKGNTPNPDVMCNKHIKFGAFLRKAREAGADFIATGHYARVVESKEKNKNTSFKLLEGIDQKKDQSYFLWTLGQEELAHTLFPIGEYTKDIVRKKAEYFNLPTAQKKDSQGVCFLGTIDLREFLGHYIDTTEGNVLNTEGEIIGHHKGAVLYTLGQRHGFTITHKGISDNALFVIAKNIKNNTIIVADKKKNPESVFITNKITLIDTNWIEGKVPNIKEVYSARLRYRQEKQPCTLLDEKTILFKDTQDAVSIGQSLVLYKNDVCCGGGIIAKTYLQT